MNVVFCWSGISGYMAACWHELSRRPEANAYVIAHAPPDGSSFQSDMLTGLPHRLLSGREQDDSHLIEQLAHEQQPDAVVVTGWWLPSYRHLIRSLPRHRTKVVMCIDSPWRHEIQFLTRARYWPTLRRVDHFFVTGERSWQYARRLGAQPSAISRGMYGIDYDQWSACAALRGGNDWPRRFLFLGRYAQEKAIDVLVKAYSHYRMLSDDPWTLTCCGKGPLGALLDGVTGIENLGFVQPHDMQAVFARSGALVMPSRFDPWPLALVEGAAAGLPIVCSEACGSAVEVVRPYFNGFIVPSENPERLAEAMLELERRRRHLPQWGARSQQLAAAYSAPLWADRWIATLQRLTHTDSSASLSCR